ncbi:MAG: SGNH/GDSL hydrolase family protein [Solirubrobacterales bacterium]
MSLARAAAPLLLIALAAAGCGGDSSSSGDSGPAKAASDPRILVAALGDSITSGSPGYDPDPAARVNYGFGEDPRSSFEYWASKKDPNLVFRNCGVFGERTDQIAARLGDCTDGAEALVIQGGINDIAQGRPVAEAAAELRAMVREGKDLGIPVAITDVLPWNNGFPTADPQIRELNTLIAGIAGDEGVPILPFHDTLEDPRRPGRMRKDLTADGDHPSVAGYRLLGEQAFSPPG